MPVVGRINICAKYRFIVEIDGIVRTGFVEVAGLNINIDVSEYREGSDLLTSVRLDPGLSHYGPLVLKYGVTCDGSKELWEWMKQTLEGNVQRKNIAIVVLDRKGNQVVRYVLTNAWPSSLRVSTLDSRSSSHLTEELVIQYEKLDIA